MVQNFQEALELLNSDQIDLIAALPLNANLVNESGLMLSTPYFTSYGVVVSSPDVTSIDYSSVQVLSANTQSTLQQLRRSRNTSILLDAHIANHYLQKPGTFYQPLFGMAQFGKYLLWCCLLPFAGCPAHSDF